MSHRPAIHRQPFLGALQQLFGHPGTPYAELGVLSSAMAEGAAQTGARELTEHLERSLRARGAVPIGEAIALARRVVDLHDRLFGEECEDRASVRSWQQLRAAVLILCSDTCPLPQRLADAWAVLGPVDDRELPAIVRARARAVQAELARIARREEGFAHLQEDEAEQATANVLLLYVHAFGARLAARPGSLTGAIAWTT